MIVKEYLTEQGVDLQHFQQFRKRPAKARRKLNRTYGGEITVPTPRTTREIKETLKVNVMWHIFYMSSIHVNQKSNVT